MVVQDWWTRHPYSTEMRHRRGDRQIEIKSFQDDTFYNHVCIQRFAHFSAVTMPGIPAIHTWLVPGMHPHAWHSSHLYMACTQHASSYMAYTRHVSPCLAFQPSIHSLHLAHVLMPGVYLAFTEPGIVIQNMVSNIFYLPAMYMRCMLANCHVPCTCPCMQPTFLLM